MYDFIWAIKAVLVFNYNVFVSLISLEEDNLIKVQLLISIKNNTIRFFNSIRKYELLSFLLHFITVSSSSVI